MSCLGYLILPASALAAENPRLLAFVVGIGEYPNLGEDQRRVLRAVRDAEDVGKAFVDLGFTITSGVGKNLTRDQFNSKWKAFVDEVKPGRGDTVAIYLTGHGMEIEGVNYFLPKNAPFKRFGRQHEMEREAISLTQLGLDLKDRRPRLALIIVDACRTNPFIPAEYASGLGGGAFTVEGALLIFAAAGGEVSLDYLNTVTPDTNPNSVFARALLPLLPELKVSNIPLYLDWFQKLNRRVRQIAQSAGQKQSPQAYPGGFVEAFCLLGECRSRDLVRVAWTPEAWGGTVPAGHQGEGGNLIWDGTSVTITPTAGKLSLAVPSNVDLSNLPTGRACELWPAIEKTANEDTILDFIARFRELRCTTLAKARLDELIRSKSTLHVISIGINNYREKSTWPPLRYAVADAESIAAAIENQMGGDYRAVEVSRLINAPKDAILQAFQKTANSAMARDTVIVFLSGHAMDSDGRSYFIPTDARKSDFSSFVDLDQLQAILARTFGRRIFLIDSIGIKFEGAIKSVLFDNNRDAQITVLAAASPGQAALEDVTSRQSLFTRTLVRGLSGDALPSGSKTITVNDLFRFVRREIARLSTPPGQVPTPYLISNDRNFALIRGR